MTREKHRISWSEPHDLTDAERAEFAGYIITESGVASPDNFTQGEIDQATAEGRIVS